MCALYCKLYIESYFVTLSRQTVKIVLLDIFFLLWPQTLLQLYPLGRLIYFWKVQILLNLKEVNRVLCKSQEQCDLRKRYPFWIRQVICCLQWEMMIDKRHKKVTPIERSEFNTRKYIENRRDFQMNFYVIVKLYNFRHLRVLLFSTLTHIYLSHDMSLIRMYIWVSW